MRETRSPPSSLCPMEEVGHERSSVPNLPDDVPPVSSDRLTLDVDPANQGEAETQELYSKNDIAIAVDCLYMEGRVSNVIKVRLQVRSESLAS